MRFWKPWLPALITYVVGGAVVFALGFRRPLQFLLVPLVILSGWFFLGHLVTIDDDFPGGWSNPQRSLAVTGRSLLQLLVKGGVFVAATTLVVRLLV